MPDDEILEESQEQTTEEAVDEGELAFSEAAEGKETPDETKPDKPSKKDEKAEKPDTKADAEKEVDKGKKPEKEVESEKKTDKKPDTEKEPDKKTARERLEARVKDDSEKKPDAEKEAESDKKPEEKAEPDAKVKETPATKAPKQLRLTKENIKTYLEFFGDDALPDKEIVIGDRTINFKELKEDEPELYDAMKVMSGFAIDKALRHMVGSGAIVTGEQMKTMQKEITDLRNEVDDTRFWSEVARTHPDVHQLMTSKDFTVWRDKQSKSIQKLAKNIDTPQDAIDIIDAYKEDLAKEKTKEHDSGLERKKKETDDLHKHTMKSTKTHKSSAKSERDEGEAAFNEEAKKKKE